MTPADYVNEIAIPALADFAVGRRSRRLAYVAAMTTFHIADHIHNAGGGKLGAIHQTMRHALPAFDVVRAVATAAKHFETDPKRHVVLFKAGEDYDRPPALADDLEVDASILGDWYGGREVQTAGQSHDLYDATRALLLAFIATFPDYLSGCSYVEPADQP